MDIYGKLRAITNEQFLSFLSNENNVDGDAVSLFRDTLCLRNNAEFVFEMHGDQLQWKKKLRNAKYLYATFDLIEVADDEQKDEIMRDYLLFSIEKLQSLEAKLDDADKTILKLTTERDESLQTLESAVKAKEECEVMLLGKFVQILNAKKRKIASLLEDRTPEPTCSDVDPKDMIKEDLNSDTEQDVSSNSKDNTPLKNDSCRESSPSLPDAIQDDNEFMEIDEKLLTMKNSKLFVNARNRPSQR